MCYPGGRLCFVVLIWRHDGGSFGGDVFRREAREGLSPPRLPHFGTVENAKQRDAAMRYSSTAVPILKAVDQHITVCDMHVLLYPALMFVGNSNTNKFVASTTTKVAAGKYNNKG